jgi:integrative and conjugative element protein (TIGR02256 family)
MRTKEASPNETGGILIGYIDQKNKVIIVTRQIDPPEDSIGWPYAFKMGVKGIPEKVKAIMEKTGNLIGYVGEWHSHPQGSNRLSSKDQDAIKQLEVTLSKRGIPTFTLIVTLSSCYPYVSPSRLGEGIYRKGS